MPTIEVRTDHELPAAEAVKKLRLFGENLKGITIDGELVVDDDQALVRCRLPFAAMLFRGRIESDIQKTLREALTGPA